MVFFMLLDDIFWSCEEETISTALRPHHLSGDDAFVFAISQWQAMAGTALRASGSSGDQTFAFGLQFRSGEPANYLGRGRAVEPKKPPVVAA